MKKFAAIYMATPEQMAEWANSTPEDKKAGMEEWMAWAEQHKADFIEMGSPFGKNLKVTASGTEVVSNGMAGYSIVQAESAEAAAAIFADNPHLKQPGAWVDVMECMPM